MTPDHALIAWAGFGLPETVALSAIAVLGYLVGRWGRGVSPAPAPTEDVARALRIARELESIATALRRDLASHQSEVERFKRESREAATRDEAAAWGVLRDEAERVLAPTLRLVGQVASAYDQIRQQTQALAAFSGGRTDPATGLHNSRALGELLQVELSGHAATRDDFSVAVVSVDAAVDLPGDTRAERDERVLRASELLRTQLRDRDLIARYGVGELVVVMPHTRLYGACMFGRRMRKTLAEQGGLAVSCGLAQSSPTDSPKGLLARADSALYSARAAGGGLYLHTGKTIRPDEASPAELRSAPAAEVEAAAPLRVVGAGDD